MPTSNIDEVQSRLPQIINALRPDEELVITRGDQAVARLLPPERPTGTPKIGRGKDMLITHIDDDEHLEDFAEYLPRGCSSTPTRCSRRTGAIPN
jgi:antitoxin (DNA-binding transcriptional repressor) of toxin-antitoxin stability system